MATGNFNGDIRKKKRGNSAGARSENRLLLSTSYPLNASDTKRIQVGLQPVADGGIFEPIIKLSGSTSSGIRLDFDTWTKLKENMAIAASYLRRDTEEIPHPILLNDITLHFTSAYGARAIMLSLRPKTSEENSATAKPANDDANQSQPTAKKQKLYIPGIVMQKISFEGLEDIAKCIDAKYAQLQSYTNHVNDCTRYLINEIELNLPKKTTVDEDIVKQTLTGKYQEIEENVRRQIKDLQFLDSCFCIIFKELTSIYFNLIAQFIIQELSS